MFSKITKFFILFSVAIVLSACSNLLSNKSNSISGFSEKEKFYQATNNYRSLIGFYRSALKQQEDPLIRYKLALNYYKAGDSHSSELYLSPLLNQHLSAQLHQDVLLLSVKNYLQMKKYQQAILTAQEIISKYKSNAEAYNLLGIAYAKLGNFDKARENIQLARKYFINDITALNNLALLSIIEGDYKKAVDMLLPQYINGVKEERMLHNLVFALVKKGDKTYAEHIIRKERLNTSPKDLVEALSKVSQRSMKNRSSR